MERGKRRSLKLRVAGLKAAFAAVCAIAAAPAWAADGPVSETPSSVWEVTRGRSTVFLGGTVHLLRAQDHPLPHAFQTAFERSQRLFFEVDLKQFESPEGRRRVSELSRLPDGQRLPDRISKPLYAQLQEFLKGRGMPGEQLDRLTPSMAAMMVTSIEAARLGARPDLGVEPVFDRKAREVGKPVLGLETPEFQLRLFEQLTAREQEELLRLTVENIQDTEKDLSDLIQAWRQGDANRLDEVLNRHFEGHERLKKVILFDRNRAWIPAIEKALQGDSETALFLVGVGHLVGNQGVIQLLREKGYEVSWVRGK